ncbi:MAG: UDP-4-amino-4,6-dideoxy-N-acetyl-beta-L-altrosamine transaminase [Candidatus Marinimicrobia bacterium]|nr:UDP-4-amino-4,6-dideoxy-N-acetyl-beta-L-altrosamine transaminase [Candidatus Neomarinimicrobiota bacterium]
MISYGKQTIDKSDIEALVDVLKSDWLTQGPAITNFENDLSSFFGSDYACALANGTAALHLAGLALGWTENDIIITTPITFLATANCILYSGATPDFVDIDPKTYTIEPNLLEEKVDFYRSNGKNIKAIIGVDYAGHPCDWKSLRQIADKYDLILINDNCHAMGSLYDGSKKYAIKYADVITQSYHPVKHITTGEGGSVLTNNKDLIDKIISLRSHGIGKGNDKSELNHNDPWYYEMEKLGYNYRITDFQCALGSNQLRKLEGFVAKRSFIAEQYNQYFKEINNLIIPFVNHDVQHSYHLYPLQINFKSFEINKRDFFIKMKKSGINLQVHYIPIHYQPFYANKFGFKKGDFPNSEKFYENIFSMPIFPSLSSKDLRFIIDSTIKHLSIKK